MTQEALDIFMSELRDTIQYQQKTILELTNEVKDLKASIHKNHIEALYTVPEVARMIKLSERQVRKLCTEDVIEHVLVGSQIRIPSSKLQAYLDIRGEKINHRSTDKYHPRTKKRKAMSP